MSTEKPQRKPGAMCPLLKKDISKVCHKCEFYMQIKGTDPTSGEQLDNWGCAMVFGVLAQFENANMQRQTGAAIESFRNETIKGNRQAMQMIAATTPRSHNGGNVLTLPNGDGGDAA